MTESQTGPIEYGKLSVGEFVHRAPLGSLLIILSSVVSTVGGLGYYFGKAEKPQASQSTAKDESASPTHQIGQPANLELSSRMPSEKIAEAKSFLATIENSVWTADCGKESFEFSFGPKGAITLNGGWAGYTWAVTSGRSVAMTGQDGGRAYFIFDHRINTLKFIWGPDLVCNGKRS